MALRVLAGHNGFDTLAECGADLVKALPFADHHLYSEADLTRLHLEATQLGSRDYYHPERLVRLPPEWRERVLVLDVGLMLEDGDADNLLRAMMPHLDKKDR